MPCLPFDLATVGRARAASDRPASTGRGVHDARLQPQGQGWQGQQAGTPGRHAASSSGLSGRSGLQATGYEGPRSNQAALGWVGKSQGDWSLDASAASPGTPGSGSAARRSAETALEPAAGQRRMRGTAGASGSPGVGDGTSDTSAVELERYLAQQCAPYSPAKGAQPGSVLAALPHLRLIQQTHPHQGVPAAAAASNPASLVSVAPAAPLGGLGGGHALTHPIAPAVDAYAPGLRGPGMTHPTGVANAAGGAFGSLSAGHHAASYVYASQGLAPGGQEDVLRLRAAPASLVRVVYE